MSEKPRNPFKGLESYKRSDFGGLFGREIDFSLMRGRVFAGRTTLLFAGPGVGKTSFFEAKFIPEMERRHAGDLTICYHREWTGGRPLDSVRQSLGAAESESLIQFFERKGGRWILVLDQFEELFQNPDYWTTSLALREEIASVVTSKLPVSIVFSMREEFLGHLSFLDNKIPDVFQNYYRLRNPNRDAATDIIEMTCGDVAIDRAGLARLVDDLMKVEVPSAASQPRYLTRESVRLPYLQLVCQALWDRQSAATTDGGKGFVFLSDYPAVGPAQMSPAAEILEDYCGARLNKLPAAQRLLAAHALDYLVTSQGAKRAYEAGALTELMRVKKPAALEGALNAMRDAGMLRAWDRGEEHWYELAHDMYAPILYRWKGRFQEQYNQRRAALTTSVVAAALVFSFAAFLFYRAKTKNDLANSLDARASYQELQQDRDQAILLRMAALDADPTDERRRAAAAIAYPADQLQFTLRHDAPVTALNYTADGKFIVTAAGLPAAAVDLDADIDKESRTPAPRTLVQAWNAADGKPAGSPWSIRENVSLVAIVPSGALLATADNSDEPSFTLHEANGMEGSAYSAASPLERMAFNQDGTRLVLAGRRQSGTPWSVQMVTGASGEPAALRPLIPWTTSDVVAFSPDGTHVASSFQLPGDKPAVKGDVGGSGVLLWETASGKPLGPPLRHEARIASLEFSHDGRRLYAGERTGRITVYDAATGRPTGKHLDANGWISRMDESPDGASLLAVTHGPDVQDGRFIRWDLATGNRTEAPSRGGASTEGRPLAGPNLVFEVEYRRVVLRSAAQGVPVQHAASDGAAALTIVSPDCRQMLTSNAGTVHAWSLTQPTTPYPDGIQAYGVVLARDGSRAAMLTSNRSLLVRTFSPKPAAQTVTTPFEAYAAAISSNGDYVAARGANATQVWDMRSGTPLPVIPSGGNLQIALRDDGAFLARASNSVLIFPRGGTTPKALTANPPPDTLSRWGSYFAAYTETGDLSVVDTSTGSKQSFPMAADTRAVFSNDERYVFMQSRHADTAVIDLHTGKRTVLHQQGAEQIAISPDARYAITSAGDSEVRVWQLDDGKQLGGAQFGGGVQSLAFTTGGSLFVASRRWAYWFPPVGSPTARIGRPLSAPWSTDYNSGANTGIAFLTPARGWIYPVDLKPEYVVPPLAGEPEELRRMWQTKLNLYLVSGEISPLLEVRVPRSDTSRAR